MWLTNIIEITESLGGCELYYHEYLEFGESKYDINMHAPPCYIFSSGKIS